MYLYLPNLHNDIMSHTIVIFILQKQKLRSKEFSKNTKQSDSRAKTLTGLLIFTIPILICSKARPRGRSLSFSGCSACHEW